MTNADLLKSLNARRAISDAAAARERTWKAQDEKAKLTLSAPNGFLGAREVVSKAVAQHPLRDGTFDAAPSNHLPLYGKAIMLRFQMEQAPQQGAFTAVTLDGERIALQPKALMLDGRIPPFATARVYGAEAYRGELLRANGERLIVELRNPASQDPQLVAWVRKTDGTCASQTMTTQSWGRQSPAGRPVQLGDHYHYDYFGARPGGHTPGRY